MDFKEYLKTNALKIDQELETYFKLWRESIKRVSPKLLPLIDVSIDACQGGKRLRGVLIKLGYEIAGGSKNNFEIYKPAVAYEIFQTAILAHDDIIDKSPTRRGKPTIYKTLGADHHAISQTICLGDIGYFLAIQTLLESNFPESNKNQATKQFAKAMTDTAFGQMLDVELPYLDEEKNEADVITISRYKTAWYTIVGPMQLGVTLAGANQKLLDSIKIFGENLGIAYQIQDDILGVFGDEGQLGKSVTSDIEEGKITLLYLEALKKANPTQKQTLDKYYGKQALDSDQLEMIRQLFKETLALSYAQQKAQDYVSKAKQVIPQITDVPEFTKLLNQMSDYLIKRIK